MSYSASCSLSFTKANDNLQRAEWLYHAGANPHFEKNVIFILKRELSVISKREFWVVIFDWEQRLVLGFIRDFERIIISDKISDEAKY